MEVNLPKSSACPGNLLSLVMQGSNEIKVAIMDLMLRFDTENCDILHKSHKFEIIREAFRILEWKLRVEEGIIPAIRPSLRVRLPMVSAVVSPSHFHIRSSRPSEPRKGAFAEDDEGSKRRKVEGTDMFLNSVINFSSLISNYNNGICIAG